MSKKTYICLEHDDQIKEYLIEDKLYIQVDSNVIDISMNSGAIKLELAEDILSLKIRKDLNNAEFNGHPVKKGAIYFLDEDDNFTVNGHQVKKIQKAEEVITLSEEDTDGLDDIDEQTREAAANSDKTLVMKSNLSAPKELSKNTEEDQEEIESKRTTEELEEIEEVKEEDSDFSFDMSADQLAPDPEADLENESQNITRTSIDINELLQEAEKEKQKRRRKKKKEKNSVKKSKKTKKKKGSVVDISSIVGPVTRFFGVLATLSLTIGSFPYLNNETLSGIINPILTNINNILSKQGISEIPNEVVKIIFIFISFEAVSRLLFSTSLPLFLCGVTNTGNIVTKRLKALLRLPLDIISMICPLGEIPTIFGNRSLKELATFSFLRYRLRPLRVFAPILLATITIGSLFHPIIMDLTPPFDKTPRSQLERIINSRHEQIGQLTIPRSFLDNFLILGTTKPNMHYTLIDKENGESLEVKHISTIKYNELQNLNQTIPFFKFAFPALSKHLETSEPDSKTREDVLSLIKTGEILQTQDLKIFYQLSPLAITASHNFFKELRIPIQTIKTSEDGMYRLYQNNKDYYAIYLGEESLSLFFIEYTDKSTERVVSRIQLVDSRESQKLLPFEQMLARKESEGVVDMTFINSKKDLKGLMNLDKPKAVNIYNRHIKALINAMQTIYQQEDTLIEDELSQLIISED